MQRFTVLQQLPNGFLCGYCPAHPQKAEQGQPARGVRGRRVGVAVVDSGVVVGA